MGRGTATEGGSRVMSAYELGRAAFLADRFRCEFKRGDLRVTRWWNGWLDARTELNLGMKRCEWGDVNERLRATARRDAEG